MRVGVVAPGYAPALGGVETVVTQVSRELVRLGCDVEVWTHQTTPAEAATTQDRGVLVRRFARAPRGRYPLSPALWRHSVSAAPGMDVVHVHGYHSSCGLGLALRPPAVPLVVSPHYHGGGHTSAARLLHVGYAPLGRRLLAAAGRVVAVSAAEQALLRRDVPALTDRVTVVHNGADTAAIAAAEPFDGEPPTVVVAGRLEPYKRVDAAIAAFAEVGSPAQLVIVGDGPDRRRLEALAEATARAKTVRFTGRVTDVELARWLRTARCVVSLSEHEAFGLVGLEASAAGARVVLSAIDAHREVAELLGAEVTLVESADRAAVTAAMTAALAAPPEGPHPVRTWADVAADYLDIYAGLVTS